MSWSFNKFNNLRTRIEFKKEEKNYLVERFSTDKYSRLRVFETDKELNVYNKKRTNVEILESNEEVLDFIHALYSTSKPKKKTTSTKKKTKTKKPKKDFLEKISEEQVKAFGVFGSDDLKIKGLTDEEKEQEKQDKLNSLLIEEEEDLFGFDNGETSKTVDPKVIERKETKDFNYFLEANELETEKVVEKEGNSDDDFFDFLDKADELMENEEPKEIEEDYSFLFEKEETSDNNQEEIIDMNDFSMDTLEEKANQERERELRLETAKKDIVKETDLNDTTQIVKDHENRTRTLMENLLSIKEIDSTVVGEEFLDTVPMFNGLKVAYDLLEKYEDKNKSKLLTKFEFGDRIKSLELYSYIDYIIRYTNSELEKSKEKLMWDLLDAKETKREAYYKSIETVIVIDGEDDEEEAEIFFIYNVDGELIAKIIETENYKIRVDLDFKITSFKSNNTILERTPYVKSTIPNPYKVLKDIGNEYKSIQLPPIAYFRKILNMDYLDTANYLIIDTLEKLRMVKDIINALPQDWVISYDAETTGLDFNRWLKEEDRSELVTHSFSWMDNQSIIIPVRMKYCRNIDPEVFKEEFKEIMETRRFLAHNGAADVRFNMYDGIRLNIVEDTYHLAKHLMPYLRVNETTGKSESRSSVTRSLESLVRRAFGEDLINMNKYVFKPAGLEFDFSIVNEEYMIAYGCPDTDKLRQLWKAWRPKLEDKQEIAYLATVRSSCIMAEQATFNGIKLFDSVFLDGKVKAEINRDHLEKIALDLVGETKDTLNIGSATKLANFIFGKYGVPITKDSKRTAKGLLSSDKEVLAEISDIKLKKSSEIFKEDILNVDGKAILTAENLNMMKYPFCAIVAKYKDVSADLTANYNRLMNKAKDGIYYPEFKVGSTATWRSTEGIQTVKSSLKHGLGVYSDKYYHVAMDFNAEELRFAVNQSDDDVFKDILMGEESDAHTSAGANVFSLKEYQITKDLRAKAKACNFGIIYGMKAHALAQQISNTRNPTKEQVREAQEIYDLYVYKFSEMIKALQPAREFVLENGYIYNNLNYKMIYDDVLDLEDYESQIFDMKDTNPPVVRLDPIRYEQYRGSLGNKAGNYPIQSWGGGLLMLLIIKWDKVIREHGLEDKVFMPLIVHDEINLIVHESVPSYLIIKLLLEVFQLDMSYLGKRTVPLYLGIGIGDSWGQAGGDAPEIPVHLQHMLADEYDQGVYPKDLKATELYDHFLYRIQEYMRERLQDKLSYILESKVYDTGRVIDTLRGETFLLKRANSIFKFFVVKGDIYDHHKILETILYGTDIEFNEVEFKLTDPTETENELDKANDVQEFFFQPFIHTSIITIGENMTIDLTGKPKSVITEMLRYINYFKSNTGDKNEKQVNIKLGEQSTKIDGLKIMGFPMNANTVITNILNGNPAPARMANGKIQEIKIEKAFSDILFEDNGRKYLDISSFEKETITERFKEIVEVLKPYMYVGTDEEKLILLSEGGETALGFSIGNIPMSASEKILDIVRIA